MQAQTQPNTGTLQPGDLLDETQAAAILGITVSTLRNWRWKGIGPRYQKIGLRLVRYPRTELATFVAGGAA